MSDYVRALPLDLEEAYRCGTEAVSLAEKGKSGYMINIVRMSDDPYTVTYGKVPLNDVADASRPMPEEYFNKEGNFVLRLS